MNVIIIDMLILFQAPMHLTVHRNAILARLDNIAQVEDQMPWIVIQAHFQSVVR